MRKAPCSLLLCYQTLYLSICMEKLGCQIFIQQESARPTAVACTPFRGMTCSTHPAPVHLLVKIQVSPSWSCKVMQGHMLKHHWSFRASVQQSHRDPRLQTGSIPGSNGLSSWWILEVQFRAFPVSLFQNETTPTAHGRAWLWRSQGMYFGGAP